MNFVAVDMGASSTRHVSNFGNCEVLPNNMVIMDKLQEKVALEPYSSSIESALDVTIEKTGNSKMFPVRALVGELADRYLPTNERPTVMRNKSAQRINYISAILACAVRKLKDGLSDDIYLYLALPPVEAKSAQEIMAEELVGEFKVTFHKYQNKVVRLNIKELTCYEESVMAILSYLFNKDGSIRDESKKYANGCIMSMDIGASTTDLAIVRDMRYLEKSGQTYKTGGNIAREIISNDVRREFGYDITDRQAEDVIAEGRIQLGNEYRDVSEFVSEAKKKFASQIITQIQGYFRTINIPIQQVRAIIVSGGGSMRGQYLDSHGNAIITTPPISQYITDELSEVCPGIDVIIFSENPRLANINGLFIRASIDVRTKEMKMQSNAGNEVIGE